VAALMELRSSSVFSSSNVFVKSIRIISFLLHFFLCFLYDILLLEPTPILDMVLILIMVVYLTVPVYRILLD